MPRRPEQPRPEGSSPEGSSPERSGARDRVPQGSAPDPRPDAARSTRRGLGGVIGEATRPGEGDIATGVTSTLLAGPLTFGGLAWLADRYWLDAPWLIPVGVILGLALSVYVIWLRYGTG